MALPCLTPALRDRGHGPSLSDTCFKRQGNMALPYLTPALRAMNFDTRLPHLTQVDIKPPLK